jgi:MFS transporter, CP family, cyanate transporter
MSAHVTAATASRPEAGSKPMRRAEHLLLLAALALTGLTMRTAVTSVGAALGGIERGLGAGPAMAGVITTLPALCFALFGALAPRVARRIGPHRLLVLALAAMTAGLVCRAVVGAVWLFVLFSVVSLVGAAVANVLMPTLVKWHFPDRIGPMTALYTTALAIGTTAGAGLTVPIGSLVGDGGSWRWGIGSWALLSAVAVLPWLSTLRHDVHFTSAPARMPISRLVRSRTAWTVALFFAFQSFQAYIAFGWFEGFLTAHGVSEVTAGWLVALLSAMSIPLSLLAPMTPMRYHRALLLGLGGSFVVAYAGMMLSPADGAWVWMVLAGIGSGMFPFSLALIGFRSASAETTASLSAFSQSLGYVIAATGPLLFGVLHEVTDGWSAPFALLWFAVAAAVASGWLACAPRQVEDDLAARAGQTH